MSSMGIFRTSASAPALYHLAYWRQHVSAVPFALPPMEDGSSFFLSAGPGTTQRCHDRAALQLPSSGAGIDKLLKPALDALQLRDLVLDLFEPALGLAFDAMHVAPAIGRQRQELSDLREREAQLLRAKDELELFEVRLPVLPISRRAALRGWEQSPPLVMGYR